MTRTSKREYFQAIVRRYHRRNRARKSTILDEFCAVCELNRNYAIRLLNRGYPKHRKRPGRASRYQDLKFLSALCGGFGPVRAGSLREAPKTGYAALGSSVRAGLWENSGELHRDKLFKVSAATIDRLLRPSRAHAGRGRGLTKPGSILRNEIEISGSVWDETRPGFVEADTVAHCGASGKGPFVLTVTLTDIATQWTESRAIWTKTAERVVEAIQDRASECCQP
jgi:hypothetical protein